MKAQFTRLMPLFLLLIIFNFPKSNYAQRASFLVNCGTNTSINIEGRRWIGDTFHVNNVTLSNPSTAASATNFKGDSVYEPIYRSARLFTDNFNYTFRVVEGNYFLRLHFYPLGFDRYNANESYFDIEANGLKLVTKFNVLGEILNKNSNLVRSRGNSSYFLVKEYLISVDGDMIVVNFVPVKGSFGFVNAVEIVEEGNHLFNSSDLIKRGIETVYRLNVGGLSIKPSQDSLFWRFWEDDSSYMINSDAGVEIRNRSVITYSSPNTFAAPLAVYEAARTLTNTQVMEKRFNMSWKLRVDPDFDYLVRLHFCELNYEKPHERVFRIYIDNRTAVANFDVYVRAGGLNKAYHEDHLDSVSSESSSIWVQLGPDPTTGSAGTDALLNGIEVFKLGRDGNLAYVERYVNLEIKKGSRSLILWVEIGAGIAFLAATCLFFVWLCKKKQLKKDNTKNLNGQMSSVRTGRRFTLTEITLATNNFDESLVIGVGGFGKVFKGEIDENTLVAIKRSNPQSQQGLREFETEIEMLSKLRHRHLVSLIGYCDEKNEMILVYEYMANGTLRGHLFGSDLPPLSWKQRVGICIGAARGLHYLHTGSDRGIIHRDVKTTNILLDENFIAKMSDFGLSKTGPSLEHTHVSTAVKGSFGYLDPEYFRRQQLTEKSDIYSFGVVLFEVVCARAVINPTLPKDEINLAEWAMRRQREVGSLEGILDGKLKGKCCVESLMRFGEIAEKCLADEGRNRPTMGEVLWHLEYVLSLHEAWLSRNGGDVLVSVDQTYADVGLQSTIVEESKLLSRNENLVDPLDPRVVGIDEFSQMVNLGGR